MSEEFKFLSEEELLTGITKVNPIKPKHPHGTSSVERTNNRRRDASRRSGNRPQDQHSKSASQSAKRASNRKPGRYAASKRNAPRRIT